MEMPDARNPVRFVMDPRVDQIAERIRTQWGYERVERDDIAIVLETFLDLTEGGDPDA